MSKEMIYVIFAVAAYFCGPIPFGFLIGKMAHV